MEEYPEELRTPPVALVSLVGCPELHYTISSFLHSEQPPINTLALPDFSKISVVTGKHMKTHQDSGQSSGFLKRGWLAKHRTRVPSVVAAMFSWEHVNGDPAQWLQVCTDLETLKTGIHGRNIKLVVVLVQSTIQDHVSEDRMIALRKHAEIDSKYLVTFVQNDTIELRESLNRLANIFSELSNTYYREEGQRLKTRVEKKSSSSIELNIRYWFKVAVYAEFRRDWIEALRFYEDAYHALREIVGKSTRLPPIQRLIEIKSVAEQLHFKVSTLLLHDGRVVEAVKWFWQHIACYKALVGIPEAFFLHWEWVSIQFLVFAELLETCSGAASIQSSASERPMTEWEYRPAYYYQLAAHYLSEKKKCLDISLSTLETSSEHHLNGANMDSVVPSACVGQFARLIEQGDTFLMQPLSDAEYMVHTLAKGKRFQDSYEIIALLRKSLDLYSNLKAQKMASYCSNLMGREYFALGDFGNAKQLLDGITALYRQEGWVSLLWETLGYLRECSKRLSLLKDFVEYSLEMAALPLSTGGKEENSDHKGKYSPAAPPRPSQREIIHKEVSGILKGEPVFGLTTTEEHPLFLEIDPVSPLRAVLLATVAFHSQVVKPGVSTLFTLALLTQLSNPFEIDQLEIQFNQFQCNFIVRNGQKPPLAEGTAEEPRLRVETAPVLSLIANKWLRLTYEIKWGQSCKLECLSVIVKIGQHARICCRAESPASMEDLPLWKFEDRVETIPTKDPGLAFSGQKFIQVEEPVPLVELVLSTSGPALVGEVFPVLLTVTSKGHPVHSGELKINLVDTKGGLLSPRATESFSLDSLNVELMGISESNDEFESQIGFESIRKIQQSFGLVSVPFLNLGESWSCSLDIKWHKPKSVTLYVSLGYSPSEMESKVHVHRSLQLEGKTAITISDRFMMPFRQDPLLLSKNKRELQSDLLTSLALNETSVLIMTAKSCSEVPLRIISISVEADENISNSRLIRDDCSTSSLLALVGPGEEFKWVLSVTPLVHSPKLGLGTACVTWKRDIGLMQSVSSQAEVVTRHKLPDVNVEKAPLVVSLDCPPHAVLGVPFSFYVRIQNQTPLLQEIRYSLVDSQSFLLSGVHCDTVFVLPNSKQLLAYKLVPLASGPQQLPQITINAERFSAELKPSPAASTIFILPSEPHLRIW